MGRVAFDFKLRLLVVDKNCFPKRACALERQRTTLAASGLGASVLSFFLECQCHWAVPPSFSISRSSLH
jgi:hypothetical protein